MLASRLPVERPPQDLRPGVDRGWVDSNYGYPVAAGDDGNGVLVEQVQFVDGVPKSWKSMRIVIHSSLDYVSFCIWEIVGTPLELFSLALGNPSYTYYLIYDEDGKLKRVIAADTEEGRRYSQMPWAVAHTVGLPVNTSAKVRNTLVSDQSSEDEPKPDVATVVPPPAPHQSAIYKIISCKRDEGSDFSYRFVLELKGEEQNSLRAFRTVQQEFRATIKEDYAESFPSVKQDSLFVEFPEYELKDGRIVGRAVVLTISVASLTYDPNTRKGKLAVRVNANQYEEARQWVRKNIETLARDKNIALTTGEIPPAAKFYLGREEFKDGNTLEIEFKTE